MKQFFKDAVVAVLNGRTMVPQKIEVEMNCYGRWDNAKGEPLNRDASNLEKPLMDALCEALGLGKNGRGDRWEYRMTRAKKKHEQEFIWVGIRPYYG